MNGILYLAVGSFGYETYSCASFCIHPRTHSSEHALLPLFDLPRSSTRPTLFICESPVAPQTI
eukprot:4231718-Prymnesium_polylepis.1